MNIEFESTVWYWRGPAPYHFAKVPQEFSADIKGIAKLVTYGWGMIPVKVRIGGTEWETSLFPKDGGYLVPLKDSIRTAEGLEVDDQITLTLSIATRW